jgi:hypothetical protein
MRHWNPRNGATPVPALEDELAARLQDISLGPELGILSDCRGHFGVAAQNVVYIARMLWRTGSELYEAAGGATDAAMSEGGAQ